MSDIKFDKETGIASIELNKEQFLLETLQMSSAINCNIQKIINKRDNLILQLIPNDLIIELIKTLKDELEIRKLKGDK